MTNIYDEIAARMIDQMEQGIIPWRQPWVNMGGAVSYSTGKAYSLLNQLILGKPGEYITYKQAEAAGGHVKKGAKARHVVFWKPITVKEDSDEETEDGDGEETYRTHFMLKYFSVFHIDDCEGISPKWEKELNTGLQPIERAEEALQGYVKRSGVDLEMELSCKAYYQPALDTIHLPILEQFESAEAFYETAFHEAAHSTGHSSRLGRIKADKAAAFGSETYSKEELVAELSSAAIMHELGLETPQTFTNNTAYIQSWLKALKDDKRLLVSAATKADKAVRMILDIRE